MYSTVARSGVEPGLRLGSTRLVPIAQSGTSATRVRASYPRGACNAEKVEVAGSSPARGTVPLVTISVIASRRSPKRTPESESETPGQACDASQDTAKVGWNTDDGTIAKDLTGWTGSRSTFC